LPKTSLPKCLSPRYRLPALATVSRPCLICAIAARNCSALPTLVCFPFTNTVGVA
jgi:hypothetical protein